MSTKIFENLNDRQKEAVKATEGKVRVIAGAGSGKTKVLVCRYAHLVEDLGIDPANILCMTFTNKAAQEMKNRIAKLVNTGNINDFVCTIHGFCVKFLRREIYRIGYPKNFTIIDEEDSKSIAKQTIEKFGLERTTTTVKNFLKGVRLFKSMRNFEASISYIKEIILPNASITKQHYEDPIIYYILLQLKDYALDFQDLIYFTLYILETFEDARKYWQNKLNYIQVDEVQDCNGNDWKLINTLSQQYNNLFIVGDPDQAIYEWRGATPGGLINFESDTDIILNENYRSTPNILDVANSIIVHNKKRIEKDLFTKKAKGSIVIYHHGKTEMAEAEWIANQIETIVKAGHDFSDIAILYRASYLSRAIEQALQGKQIRYTVWGGIRFFERKEIKYALSYLRLICYKDDISFRRIINVPSRKFGKKTLEKLTNIATAENSNLYDALISHKKEETFNKEPIQKFIQLIEYCTEIRNTSSISDLLEYVLKESGLKEMLRMDEDEERLENIAELQNSIKFYEEDNKEENITLETYLQDIALYTNADYKKDASFVKLMTIHQAKGLEFPFVFICGMSEGIFPSHRAIRERKKNAEEEERRLMYVAVTRAEKALFLTDSEGFNNATNTNKYPSRFINEIKEELIKTDGDIDPILFEGTKNLVQNLEIKINEINIQLKKGETVFHNFFGKGTILEVNTEQNSYKVQFGEATRDIRGTFLKLEKNEQNTMNKTPTVVFYDKQIMLKKLRVGDLITIQGWKRDGIIKEISNDKMLVNYFHNYVNDLSEEWITPNNDIDLVLSPKKNCYLKLEYNRKCYYLYVKDFVCQEDGVLLVGIASSLCYENIPVFINLGCKYEECSEDEFKQHCEDIGTFEKMKKNMAIS